MKSIDRFSLLTRRFAAHRRLPTALAIALHLAVALPLAARLNVWLDEAWTMETTANGFLYAWRAALAIEHQAPLYFALLAVWRDLNGSLLFARLFSIVCIAATIALLPALLKRFAPGAENESRGLEIFLPFVVAVHPYAIWASIEARVYAAVVLLSALLLLVWFDGYVAEKPRRPMQALYVSLAVLALYTNYYLGFLLFANACALLALGRRRALRAYVWQMFAAGLCFLPLVFAVRQQFAVNADYYREPTSLTEGARVVWNALNQFLLPSAEWETTAFLRVWSARAAAVALLFLVVRNYRRIEPLTAALGCVAFVIAAFLMAAYFLTGAEYVQMRHCAVFFVPLLLLLAALSANIMEKNRGWLAWLVLLAIFVPTRLYSDYAPLAKNGDWSRVARFIERNEANDEPIATFQLHDAIPLAFAYHGKNRVVRAEPLDHLAPEGAPLTAGRWRGQIEVLIGQIPNDQKRFWLVVESYCFDDEKSIECRPLEDFVAADFTVERSADFYRRRVRLLKRKDKE